MTVKSETKIKRASESAEKETLAENRQLTNANNELQKTNDRLQYSNAEIKKKGISQKATFTRDLASGEARNKKLKDTAIKTSKAAKTNRAKMQKKDGEIDQLNKELLTFTHISSHNLQEPLRKLQLIASIILEKEEMNLSEAGKDYFRRMQKSALRIQELIHDLIEYANTNRIYFKLEKTDLGKLLRGAVKDLKTLIKKENAKVTFTQLCTINIVPFQFRKLFKELITNAIKFARPGIEPKIAVTSAIVKGVDLKSWELPPKKRYCHISVSDNGAGFHPRYNERIFEVFQKVHDKEVIGTGIGLATCRKIMENHGGVIRATGHPGKGTTIDLYIPLKIKKKK